MHLKEYNMEMLGTTAPSVDTHKAHCDEAAIIPGCIETIGIEGE